MWKQASWLDTHLQATVAAERFDKLSGVYPQVANGTATPTVKTRTYEAYIDKIEADGTKKLYLVGDEWMRCCSRLDDNGVEIKGYLSELEVENLILRSEEIDLGAWSVIQCSITNTSTTVLPNGDTTVNDVIHEDNTAATTHYLRPAANVSFVASTKYVYSAFLKAINRTWAQFVLVNNGVTMDASFNLSSGSVATVNNFDSSGIEDWGNGWYRCWTSWEHDASEGRTPRVFLLEADDDDTFDGLDQDSIYCWGVQIEEGVYPSSYVPTALTTATRLADELRYQGDDGNVTNDQRGKIDCKVLMPDIDNAVAPQFLSLTDGGAAADRILLYVANTAEVPRLITAATGGVAGAAVGTTDIFDGYVHTISGTYKTNDVTIDIDGTEEGSDSTADIPNDIDRIDVAQDNVGTAQINGIIADVSISKMAPREPEMTFVAFDDTPETPINGVARLDTSLTINGTTVEPDFIFSASNGFVDTSEWRPYKYGEALPIVEVATPPTIGAGSPLLGPLDDSVKFNSSNYYKAGNNTFADVTTEDFVLEVIFKKGDATNLRIIEKRDGVDEGYTFDKRVDDKIRLLIEDSSANVATAESAVLSFAWYHVMAFVDRSGSIALYVNGVQSGTTPSASSVGSMTVAQPFAIGAQSDGGSAFNSNIAWAAMWKQASWLDTHLQATVAAERFDKLTGVYPQFAHGTATPTVKSSDGYAYLDKIETDGTRRLYLVGDEWMRICSRLDNNGKLIKGYLSETDATNLILESEGIDETEWLRFRVDAYDSSVALPNGETASYDIIHEDNTASNTHFLATNATISFTSGTKYVFSAWYKQINRFWVRMQVNNNGTTSLANFNLATGAIGTTSNITEADIEDWGNGWYRCWVSWTHDASESRNPGVYLGEADNDVNFSGLDQDSVYCWGVQLEAGVDYPTSYIITKNATYSRNKDKLRYKGDDGNLGGIGSEQEGSLSCDLLLPNVNSNFTETIIDISDNAGASDRLFISRGLTTGDSLRFYGIASEGSAGTTTGSSDLSDGVVHRIGTTWQDLLMKVYIDDVEEGTPATTALMPNDLDRIDVGQNISEVNQLNGLISKLKIYRFYKDKIPK
jgi:hypothetical protein